MKITRKQALIMLGTYAAAALGKQGYAETETVRSSKYITFSIPDAQTITFVLTKYKKITVIYDNETVNFTGKELFDALKTK